MIQLRKLIFEASLQSFSFRPIQGGLGGSAFYKFIKNNTYALNVVLEYLQNNKLNS